MPPSVAVLAGDKRYPLEPGQQPAILSAGTVIVEIAGVDKTTSIHFDGRARSVTHDSLAHRSTFAVDLVRDTGFHELLVDAQPFIFATSDAKLRLDGIRELLDYLGSKSLSWSGAMFFSGTDEVLRDLRLDWAWLERHGSEIVQLGTRIADEPWTTATSRRRRADRGVPDVGATLRLLRLHPDLLEELEGGPVEFEHEDGSVKTYAPREVIIRERRRTLDTPGNRRATALLEGTADLARAVLAAAPKEVAKTLGALTSELEHTLSRSPFRDLRRRRAHHRLSVRSSIEERVDPRYVRARELHIELFDRRHWDPRVRLMPERAYVGYADAIYQGFCGQVLADHLNLKPAATPPGTGPGPHFTGDRFDLYLDVKPPAAVALRDWRDSSTRPTARRPDLVFHERATGRTALMDAKYRAKGTRASDDSLSEVQLYLQSYSRKRIAVLFPVGGGDPTERWRTHEVTDGQFSIYEVPVTGEPELAAFLEKHLDPLVELLLAA